MSRNLESTSQLTEFAPLSPEDKSSFGLLGFSKFFKLGKGIVIYIYSIILHPLFNFFMRFSVMNIGESPEPDNGNNKGNTSADNDWQQSGEDAEPSDASSLQYSVDVSEGRSLPNVLKRISNLIALKNVVSLILLSLLVNSCYVIYKLITGAYII